MPLLQKGPHGFKDILIGDCLIVAGQLLAASQIVFEEKFINQCGVAPVLACGLEGDGRSLRLPRAS